MKKILVITLLFVTGPLNSSRIQGDTSAKNIDHFLNRMKSVEKHITVDAKFFLTMTLMQIFGSNNLCQQSQNINIPFNQTNISKKSMYPIKNGSKYHNSHKVWNNRGYRQK